MSILQNLGRSAALAALAATLVGHPAGELQAQAFPTKPITFVVPFPAGNASDVAARAGRGTRQAPRPAGGGRKQDRRHRHHRRVVRGQVCARRAHAPHDLHIFCDQHRAGGQSAVSATARLRARPSGGGSGGMLLLVAPDSPAKTLAEFIDLARRNPGKLNYAHVGRGTIQHLTMEVFLSMTGLQIQPVPYKGSVQAITDIISGQIQVMFDSPSSAAPFVDNGKVRALTSAADARSVRLPSVSAVPESGIAELRDFRVGGWVGLLAPARTPEAVVKRVNEELGAIMNAPAMKQRLLQAGLEVVPAHSPAQFGQFLQADMARWQAAATAAKIPKE